MKKKSEIASDLLKTERVRLKRERRREYRRRYYLKNRERENEKNLKRYHEKYKNDPAFTAKRKAAWKRWASQQSQDWKRERSRKYRKPYSALSPYTRSKIREAYRKWANLNRDRRVEYAREYRRKNPAFGIRGKITACRRSGDIRKLAQECLDAIVRTYGKDH